MADNAVSAAKKNLILDKAGMGMMTPADDDKDGDNVMEGVKENLFMDKKRHHRPNNYVIWLGRQEHERRKLNFRPLRPRQEVSEQNLCPLHLANQNPTKPWRNLTCRKSPKETSTMLIKFTQSNAREFRVLFQH